MSLVVSPARAVDLRQRNVDNHPIASHENMGRSAGVTLASSPSATTDGAASNAFAGDTFSYWVPDTTGVTSATLTATLATAAALDFAAIEAHNLGTHGATVSIEYSTDSGTTWTVAGAAQALTDDDPVGWYFMAVTADRWRLNVTGFTAGDAISVGVCFFGAALMMDRPFYQGFTPPIAVNDVDLLNNVSAGNHLLGNSVVRRGLTFSAKFQHISATYIRGDRFQAFQHAFNNGTPFFFVWRPTQFPEMRYCWREGDTIAPSNTGPRALMGFTMNMRAYGG